MLKCFHQDAESLQDPSGGTEKSSLLVEKSELTSDLDPKIRL